MSDMPKVIRTEKGDAILGRFRDELEKFSEKKYHKITRELLLEFVQDCDYRWFFQAGRDAVRLRMRDWAKENLANVAPWFEEAHDICPGFFKHPRDYFERIDRQELVDLCKDFDFLVKLGLTPPPKHSPLEKVEDDAPVLKTTHYPNGFNSLPNIVLENRPELEGMTREQAWFNDLQQRHIAYAQFFDSIHDFLVGGIQHFEEEGSDLSKAVCDWLQELFGAIAKDNPERMFQGRYNAALGCIVFDSTRGVKKEQAQAFRKRLPSFRRPPLPHILEIEKRGKPEEQRNHEKASGGDDSSEHAHRRASVPSFSPLHNTGAVDNIAQVRSDLVPASAAEKQWNSINRVCPSSPSISRLSESRGALTHKSSKAYTPQINTAKTVQPTSATPTSSETAAPYPAYERSRFTPESVSRSNKRTSSFSSHSFHSYGASEEGESIQVRNSDTPELSMDAGFGPKPEDNDTFQRPAKRPRPEFGEARRDRFGMSNFKPGW